MSVLAVAEYRQGDLRDVSFQLITAGAELAKMLGAVRDRRDRGRRRDLLR